MSLFPPRRILVPVNFGSSASAGWDLARDWARRFGSTLEAVYAESLPALAAAEGVLPVVTRAMRLQTRRDLGLKLGAGRVHVIEGDPLTAILQLAERLAPDLIVMGTHGRAGLRRIIEGSMTEAVVRLSPVPVLSTSGPARPITSVLCPVNFTDYSQDGLAVAAAAACALGARLTALHVLPDGEAPAGAIARLKRMIDRLPEDARSRCRPVLEVQRGSVTAGILKAADRHGLVALIARRRTIFEDVVLGTTAERVLRHCPVPVLAVPARPEA